MVGLIQLAKRFQVELVREKCERHLKHCREMTTKERIKLAREYGLKELQVFRIKKWIYFLFSCALSRRWTHWSAPRNSARPCGTCWMRRRRRNRMAVYEAIIAPIWTQKHWGCKTHKLFNSIYLIPEYDFWPSPIQSLLNIDKRLSFINWIWNSLDFSFLFNIFLEF